ncbi:gamma-glutamylcyclotransferase [Mesorhizobium sp. LHD-90]|uniref:gamma-glutamylcyclotransferase n=1 Tax=Mesorhizobium sp. LHD-90 TaxID=3071414 RepID=UPI0027E15FEE|nr:gamma-glutamylcyclotransferase [Mesorhizobium sp. LHD-90]MDQ6433558.1 gamma-glutamylcyclotransferase [Mesorhizobium sp. LHD-90]
MALTPELVALCERVVADPGPEAGFIELTDQEIGDTAARLDSECGGRPLWIFAYGSLIWKPVFDPVEARRATAYGWHRSFCMDMRRWRGSSEQPGLMMAIMRGGTCHGVAYRLPEESRRQVLHDMIWRETSYPEDLASIRWLEAESDQGKVRALSFWAGPKGSFILGRLPPQEAARRIARACGHIGSNAAYLYNTVLKLGEFGIRDRNLWRLQELVAAEIAEMARLRQAAE